MGRCTMQMLFDSQQTIVDFAKSKRNLFIYGSGIYGKVCLDILKSAGIFVNGFLLSEGAGVISFGNPTFDAKKKLQELTVCDGVIIAMSHKNRCSIREDIYACAKCNFLELSDSEWAYLREEEYFREMRLLEHMYPCDVISDKKEWKNILVIRLDYIGDMIWTTPFLRELRNNCQGANISLIFNKSLISMLANCPYVDSLFPYPCTLNDLRSNDYDYLKRKVCAFVQEKLSNQHFDVAICTRELTMNSDLENVLLAAYSKAKIRIGRVNVINSSQCCNEMFFQIMSKMFSLIVKNNTIKHEVEHILDILRACHFDIQNNEMELWPTESDNFFARNIMRYNKRDIYIALGIVSNFENRTWPIKYYKQLIDDIHEKYGKHVKFVLCGGENAIVASEVLAGIDACIDLVNRTTLAEIVAVIANCDIYVGGNTGLIHMASAMHVPVVEISAQWDSGNQNSDQAVTRVGAWKTETVVVQPIQGLDEECVHAGHCIKNYSHCIMQVSVEMVENAVSDMLAKIERRKK